MKRPGFFRIALVSVAVLNLLASTACTDEFYLSEKEAAAYTRVLGTEQSANWNFDSLQGQVLEIQFDSASPPRIRNTNLLALLRATDLGALEHGVSRVSLERLALELERQLDTWIAVRLGVYVASNESVRLEQLDSVSIRFLTNPTFTYQSQRQSIAFAGRVAITINGTIEINPVSRWLSFVFGGLNGNYPLTIDVNDLDLGGEALLLSPFADAGHIRFRLTPRPGVINVRDQGSSVAPALVKDGIRQLLGERLAAPVDETFPQRYASFALPSLRLVTAPAPSPVKLEVAYQARPEAARPSLHVVARASDGKLYHARKTTGAWGSSRALSIPGLSSRIENDPALVAVAGDQLELAATGANGELIYGHWRGETWSDWRVVFAGGSSPALGYRGKPAIGASAPGQAEIVVEGRDGNLWHHRRVNGAWLAPAMIPFSAYHRQFVASPMRDPVAAHVGSYLVVVFVDGQSRLRAISFDLESRLWSEPAWYGLNETVNFAPAAVACGDQRVEVVYVGANGTPSHQSLDVVVPNGLAVGPQTNFWGTLTSTPALACSGYRQLEAVGRGTDNRLWHNRYITAAGTRNFDGRTINPGWQSWGDLNGGFAPNLGPAGESMDAVDVAATRTGLLEIVARKQPSALDNNPQQFLFHNAYNSARFGRDPWKTVHWRGYEQTSPQRLLGRPALAATDRNFELAFVGNGTNLGPTVHFGRLPESDKTQVIMTSPRVAAHPNPIDPLILSSGPGILDRLVLDDSGQLRHDRNYQDGGGVQSTPALPAGITVGSQLSAVAYGNGQIELAAVGQDGGIYHWRFRRGNWSTAVRLSGTVISNPILLHAGAGQLELLAVGGDQKLYRWRFASGAWGGWRQISGNFPINQILFGPQAAVSWGDGLIELAVVHAQTGALYRRRIGGLLDEPCAPGPLPCPPPRVFQSLGGNVIETPVLSAFGWTSLNVLAVGTDYATYSNWATASSAPYPAGSDPSVGWGGFQAIGSPGLLLGNAASAGARQLAVVAVDRQGRLFVNRYTGWQWLGFRPVLGPSPEMQLNPPLFRPALTSYGS